MKTISATGIRNYIINNTLIDVLKNHFSTKPRHTNNFNNVLINHGHKFERLVQEHLQNQFPSQWIIPKTQEETVNGIKNKIPFIFQGILKSDKLKLNGRPDIIVRADFIPKFVSNIPENLHKSFNHYVIIDIKFMTLNLSTDYSYLLKSHKNQMYKAQLYIYNLLLSEIQHFTPSEAYLLGRRFKTSKTLSNNCFSRLGPVNFNSNRDAPIQKQVDEAHQFYTNIDKYTQEDFYPNCKIPEYLNDNLTDEKNKIAKSCAEITQVYYCGPKARSFALEQGISRWDHPNCNAQLLGFKETSLLSKTINNMLDANKNNSSFHIIIPKSKLNIPISPIEFYIDFESVNDTILEDFSLFPNSISATRIYLIGVLIKYPNNITVYRSFIAENFTLEAERKLISAFLAYLYIQKLGHTNTSTFHWGNAERSMLKSAQERHPNARWGTTLSSLNLIDFCRILQEENIAMSGIFSYGLKPIARAMFNNGLIPVIWNSNEECGKDSLYSIKKISEEANEKGIILQNHPDFKGLIEYNKLDCLTMYHIIQYFRK